MAIFFWPIFGYIEKEHLLLLALNIFSTKAMHETQNKAGFAEGESFSLSPL